MLQTNQIVEFFELTTNFKNLSVAIFQTEKEY